MPVIATAGALNTNAVNLNALIPRYTISRSLRFRASATAYLNRTLTTPTNNLKWTWSAWVKRGAISASSPVFFGGDGSSSNFAGITIGTSNTLQFAQINSSVYNVQMGTSAVFRDPSAWYHTIIVYDSANATSTDRVQIYINGIRQTVTYTTGPFAQNTASKINSALGHFIGKFDYLSTCIDGYLAEVNFIDGQALTPTSFGAYDTIGVWQPIKYTGTYGTNGFYLPFTNTASIGTDSSGNGNNWTNNNLNTATANTTYDSIIDSPTSYNDGTAYGRGNYATLNPLNRSTSSLPATLTDGNLNHTTTSSGAGSPGAFSYSTSTHAMQSGKYYAEFLSNYASGSAGTNKVGLSNNFTFNYNGGNYIASNFTSAYTQQAVGTVVQIAYDADAGLYWIGTNGTFTGNPAAGTGGTSLVAPAMFFVEGYNDGTNRIDVTANFGQRPFAYTPPAGFKALNTFNLPAPSIPNPEAHFKTTLWTGTGSNQAISNRNAITQVAFSPALVWNKSRGGGFSNILTDIIRGYPLPFRSQIFTDQNVAAEARTDRLQSFDTDGFTVGSYQDVNLSGNTFVGWQWNANKSNTFNTFGTSSSNTIVNTAAGFSMVVYAGTGSNATVGHGLPKAPNLIISRPINDSSRNWPVYHSSLGSNTIYINTTAAQVIDATVWTAAPNNTVFSIGSNIDINRNINVNIAYCWTAIPGYSAFGSYVGNGNADGPFVYTGFRPRFVMIKNATAVNNWAIIDSERDSSNGSSRRQHPNLFIPDNPGAGVVLDLLSNGFKCRNSDPLENQSGQTMIYAAFAETPFKYARAR